MRQLLSQLINSTSLLSISALLLAVILGMNIYDYNNRVTVQVPPVDAKAKNGMAYKPPLVSPMRLSGVRSFNDVLERPLFNSDRRPAQGESQNNDAAIQQNELSRKWVLTGVVIANKNSMAMLQERSGPRSVKLKQDMKVDGWALTKVTPFNATLVSNGVEVVLPLYEDKL